MYKVIIVDDEPSIRLGLRTLIPWDKYQFEVVDVAANGMEALAKYEEHSPDLMIVDIRMPEMDGITLIDTIRQKDEQISFLILSGYSDFEYVRKAMTNKVKDYILKPVNEEELEQSLAQVQKELLHKREDRMLQIQEKKWRQEQWLLRVLESNPDDHKRLGEFGFVADRLSLNWPSYQVGLVSFYDEELSSDEMNRMKNGIYEKLDHMQPNSCVCFRWHQYIGWMIAKPVQRDYDLQRLYQLLSEVIQPAGIPYVMTIGPHVDQAKDILSSFQGAKSVIKQRFFLPNHSTIHPAWQWSQEGQRTLDEESFQFEPYIDKVYISLTIGNLEKAEAYVEEAGARMLAERYSEQQLKSAHIQLLTAVSARLRQQHPDLVEQENRGSHIANVIVEMYGENTFEELQQTAIKMIQQLMGHVDFNQSDVLVNKMMHLIEQQFDQPLRLETLAEVFNYNSAYLGKLFKNHTGDYFNTFLDKVRIRKAKELLTQGEKVYQVAEKVGYANVNYFHSKFKKYVGESPTAFRKQQDVIEVGDE